MSIFIYSGATQFLAIGFFVHHASLIEIAITALLLNLRHSFFGLSLVKKFSGISNVKPYLVFALTDETYALLTAMDEPDQRSKSRYYFFISILNHLYWIVGSLAGSLLGHVIKTDFKGMDFALTALFTVLVIEQYRKVSSFRPFLVAAIAGILCLIFVVSQYMLLASIVTGTIILILARKKG
jgi:4-azaleucine resistance transporter AzlC